MGVTYVDDDAWNKGSEEQLTQIDQCSYKKGGTRHIPLGVLLSWANRLEAESSEDPVQNLPIRLSSCSRGCTGERGSSG